MAQPAAAEATARPPSPCINVCALDARGVCIGCLRTGEEIGRWPGMTAGEQWRLLEVLRARRNSTR